MFDFDLLNDVFFDYLRQPRDDDSRWDATATELDKHLDAAANSGDGLAAQMAAVMRELKSRIDQRRASVRGRN